MIKLTPKQFRALQAIFIICDALLENVQDAINVLEVAKSLLKIFNAIPDYKIINSFLDDMKKKYAKEE